MLRPQRLLAGRDVAAAAIVLVALIALAKSTSVQLLQIPGYLVMVGYDLLQNPLFPGLGGVGFWLLYAIYIYALAVVIASVFRSVRERHEAGAQ